jgi:hypothetical protein
MYTISTWQISAPHLSHEHNTHIKISYSDIQINNHMYYIYVADKKHDITLLHMIEYYIIFFLCQHIGKTAACEHVIPDPQHVRLLIALFTPRYAVGKW